MIGSLDELQKQRDQLPGFWKEHIPDLVKAYQVKLHPEEDIHSNQNLNDLIWSFYPQPFLMGMRAFTEEKGKPIDWAYHDLAQEVEGFLRETRLVVKEACELTQRMLTAHCDWKGVRQADLVALNEMLDKYAPKETLSFQHNEEGGDLFFFRPNLGPEDAYIYTERLRLYTDPKKGAGVIAGKILEDLKKLLLDNAPVSRCQECKNVFIVNPQKPAMIFCSFRCGNRASKRRRSRIRESRESLVGVMDAKEF